MALVLAALAFTSCSDDDKDMQNDIVGKWHCYLTQNWDIDSNGNIIESSLFEENWDEIWEFTADGNVYTWENGSVCDYDDDWFGPYEIKDGNLMIYEGGDMDDINGGKIEKLDGNELILYWVGYDEAEKIYFKKM